VNELMSTIQESCEALAKRVDRTYVAEHGKRREVPDKLWRLYAEAGLLGVGLPEEYGGVGGGVTETIYALELTHSAGLALPLMTPNVMTRVPVLKHGTEEQKQKYLPPTAAGETHFSFAITEPDAGTNTFKTRTTAVKQTDGSYLLNGTKHFITGFVHSGVCLVVARTSPYDRENRKSGLSLMFVDPGSAGVTATAMNIALYMPEKSYVVNFDDVLVPAENLLGEEGNGIEILFDCLNPERLVVAAQNIGLSDFILAKAAGYASDRAPFDRPIATYQAVAHPLAHAKTLTEGARLLTYEAARKYDAGEAAALQTNMAKYLSSKAFAEAANAAANAFGGAFADIDQDVIPFFLQSKLNEIAPVNNNIILSYIGEHALGMPRSY
jgi:acyl-CoA dehydrogenase